MLKQRNIVFFTGLLIVGAALSACASGAGTSPKEIVFRTFDPPAESAGLLDAAAQWNKSHDVKVKVETVAIAEALAQYTREVSGGAGPDVAQQAFVWVRELGKAGLVQDLDSLVTSSRPGQGVDDFVGLDINKLDGKLFGLPWTADTYAMVYDPAVLGEAGMTTLPTDWKGFADAVTKLTTPSRSGFCFAASSGPTSDVWHLLNYYLWSHDTPLIQQNGKSWKMGVSTSQLTDAFTYLNDFFKNGTSPANLISVDNAGDPAVNTALADGRCAVAFMAPTNMKTALKANPRLLSTTVPYGSSGKPTTHLGGRSLTINPNSADQKSAWEFVQFLNTKEFFTKYYSGQFSAQQSLLKSIDFDAAVTGFVNELPTARTYAIYVDSPAPTSKYWSLTAQTLGSVFSGQSTPSQAAVTYSDAVNALLNTK